jgi:ribose transport system substrate-binding protein
MRIHGSMRLALSGFAIVLAATAARAEDSFVTQAKSLVAQLTAPGGAWTGPTTGPKAQGRKLIVFVSTDQRNGGARGVGEGAAEAAKVMGWEFRTLDGQGSTSERAAALNQAIALKPDGIIVGAIDAAEQAPVLEQAAQRSIALVGWHAGPAPGPIASPKIFTNVTTDPVEVAKAAAMYAVADSGGKAGAVIFTDSVYKIAIKKSDTMAEVMKQCSGCKLLSVEDTPLADASTRMPPLTTSLLSRFGSRWTYALSINDLTFDFSAPALESAGISGDGFPRNISAGDGSGSAFQRIRNNEYQVATVAEPLRLHGWQIIDELNRAFAGAPPSGFVAPVHLFVHSNIDADGGKQNLYDPNNGYRDAYRKIWGK